MPKKSIREVISETLASEMRRDPRVVPQPSLIVHIVQLELKLVILPSGVPITGVELC